jgi:DnaJ-class molecular chaperone
MAAKKFQEVSEAYEVLFDESKRRQYDQFGSTADAACLKGFSGFQGFQSKTQNSVLKS